MDSERDGDDGKAADILFSAQSSRHFSESDVSALQLQVLLGPQLSGSQTSTPSAIGDLNFRPNTLLRTILPGIALYHIVRLFQSIFKPCLPAQLLTWNVPFSSRFPGCPSHISSRFARTAVRRRLHQPYTPLIVIDWPGDSSYRPSPNWSPLPAGCLRCLGVLVACWLLVARMRLSGIGSSDVSTPLVSLLDLEGLVATVPLVGQMVVLGASVAGLSIVG